MRTVFEAVLCRPVLPVVSVAVVTKSTAVAAVAELFAIVVENVDVPEPEKFTSLGAAETVKPAPERLV
jgi:hypothetical protein